MSDAIAALGTLLERRTAVGPDVYTALANVTKINGVSTKRDERDTTNLSSTRVTRAPTMPDDQPVSLTINYIPGLADHKTILTSFEAGTIEHWRITYSDATFSLFTGWVSEVSPSAGGPKENLTNDIQITLDGAAPTWPT